MMRAVLATFTALVLVNSMAFAADIPMVGIDGDGNPIEVLVKKESYRNTLTKAVNGVQMSALPVLEKHDKGAAWSLRSIVIGIGISVEVGIGSIFKVGAVPRFRALFSNSTDPVLP
jgi:hypothetical protein